jgi:hypothetical protein
MKIIAECLFMDKNMRKSFDVKILSKLCITETVKYLEIKFFLECHDEYVASIHNILSPRQGNIISRSI